MARLRLFVTGLVLVLGAGCGGSDSADTKASLVARGESLLAAKQLANAAAAYKRAIEIDPRDGELRFTLAHIYFDAGTWQRAGEEAFRAADLLPERPDVQLFAAQMMNNFGRYDDAAARMTAFLAKDPDNVEALINLGNAKARLLNSNWALFKLTDARSPEEFESILHGLRPAALAEADDAAEVVFRRAVRLAPSKLEPQLALVNFVWATGRLDEGEALLRTVADRNPGHAAVNHALGALSLIRGKGAEGEQYLKNAAGTGIYGRAARLALSDFYLRGRRYQDALAVFAGSVPEDDAAGDVSRRIAAAELGLGRPSDALNRVDALIGRNSSDASALVLKTEILLSLRRFPESLRVAKQAVEKAPELADARIALGRALAETGDPERAFGEYREAARLRPRDASVQKELARASIALGREQEMLAFAREAVQRLPDDEDAALLLVRALTETKDFAGADRELLRWLGAHPDSPGALVQLGALYAARGNRAAARTAFTRAFRAAPDSLDAFSGLVSVELADRRYAEARTLVESGVAKHRDDTAYLLLAARTYEAASDDARAESVLRDALRIDPHNVAASFQLAAALDRQKRLGEGLQVMKQFVDAHPASVEARTSLAQLLEKAGRVRDAQAQYEKVIAERPSATNAAIRLAWIHVNTGGSLDAALDLALRARRQLPNSPEANDLVGVIFVRKHLPSSALPYYEQAVSLSPDDATYRYSLGFACVEASQLDRGRAELRRALQLDPRNPRAQEARVVLGLVPR
jgi:tetratricopeptide (TPR) repeat protein